MAGAAQCGGRRPDGAPCRCAGRPSGGVGTGGNLVSDGHLAALAVEHRATIVSYDSDFSRFKSVEWLTPDALL